MLEIKQRKIPSPQAFVEEIREEFGCKLAPFAAGYCRRLNIPFTEGADLMQEFYIKVQKKFPNIYPVYHKLENKSKLSYLMKMLKRNGLNLRRKYIGRVRVDELAHTHQAIHGHLYSNCPNLGSGEFYRIMATVLTEQEFSVMEMYLNGFFYKEIAVELNMPINTVGTRVSRSKKKLQQYWTP